MESEWATADLSLSLVESLHAVQCHADREFVQGSFAENGASMKRILMACKKACGCEQGCSERLQAKALAPLIRSFWSLSKAAQDGLLWSLQQGASKKRSWQLSGQVVCREAFMCLDQIGFESDFLPPSLNENVHISWVC